MFYFPQMSGLTSNIVTKKFFPTWRYLIASFSSYFYYFLYIQNAAVLRVISEGYRLRLVICAAILLRYDWADVSRLHNYEPERSADFTWRDATVQGTHTL
jgi:hypothetical protein